MPFREVIDGYFIACFVMIALKIVQLFYSIVFVHLLHSKVNFSECLEDIIMTQKLCIAIYARICMCNNTCTYSL